MAARCLDEWGIPYRIIDAKPGIAPEARALGVQARTLEAWQQFGLAEQAVAAGEKARRVRLFRKGRLQRELPIGDIGRGMTRYPYLLFHDQPKTEELLMGALARPVEWNTAAQSLRVEGGVCHYTLSTGEEGAARYVIGADGARSVVRHAAGVSFDGSTQDQMFYVADVPIKGPVEPDAVSVFFGADDLAVLFPKTGEGLFRLIGIMPRDADGTPKSFDDVKAVAREAMNLPLEIGTPKWLSEYHVHHRVVGQFKVGPLLLAGDAAHIHSPVGAQGMNTGLMDAHNLAFKLALVLKGLAPESLLDSYDAERRAFAKRLIRTTDTVFSLVAAKTLRARLMRMGGAPLAARLVLAFATLRRFAFRTVSQIGIAYHGSLVAASPLGAKTITAGLARPAAGQRFPFLPVDMGGAPENAQDLIPYGSFTVLDFGAGVPENLAEICPFSVRVQRVQAVNGAAQKAFAGCWFFIRPDKVVAFADKGFNAARFARHLEAAWGAS